MIAHRLMYHPCPYDVDEKSLREDPILQVLYDYIGKEENVRLRSPIRFDFDKRAASLGHPATHLTLLTPHCRWPVSAPLSVGHFVRFLFKHFYSEYWLAHQTLRTFPQNNHQITITDEETRFLHIACAR